MVDTGNPNELKEYIEAITKHELPHKRKSVWVGLSALSIVHEYTNQLVMHRGERLVDRLTDPDVLRTYVLAMIVELGEFIQALGWKPWRNDNRDHSQEKVLDEFADILAFLGVLITILQSHGITIDDIADAYIDKIVVNMNRFIGKLEEDQSDINRESS